MFSVHIKQNWILYHKVRTIAVCSHFYFAQLIVIKVECVTWFLRRGGGRDKYFAMLQNKDVCRLRQKAEIAVNKVNNLKPACNQK